MKQRPREEVDAIAYLIKLKIAQENADREVRKLKKENKQLQRENNELRKSRNGWRKLSITLASVILTLIGSGIAALLPLLVVKSK